MKINSDSIVETVSTLDAVPTIKAILGSARPPRTRGGCLVTVACHPPPTQAWDMAIFRMLKEAGNARLGPVAVHFQIGKTQRQHHGRGGRRVRRTQYVSRDAGEVGAA
ncbi:unnamed protein product [Phytophthora fragariaefolia]|uniref:Unnamed protein product n=1 Tax=Phytophthora fragariaefolia TaxID=1490495 RepID=A0A9W6TJY1_9STRA|nr:unnamed protein product [Phytophthora fragariaefolia]